MSTLTTGGWRVEPAFVEGAPTSPVTLMSDESGLTQLAGDQPTAWQIPWSVMSTLRVFTFRRRYELVATVGGRIYRWRRSDNEGREAWIDVWRRHGGVVRASRGRVTSPLLVMALVLLAAGSSAWVARPTRATYTRAESGALAALLSPGDLGSSWSTTNTSQLINLVGTAGLVNDPATSPPLTGVAALAETAGARAFQKCLPVTNSADRIYGAAGQYPAAQVTSPVYTNTADGGVQVAAVAQYYASTAMVAADTREMARADFGSCFAESQAVLLRTVVAGPSGVTTALEHNPTTVAGVFVRGGVAPANLSSIGVSPLSLVVDVITHQHVEVSVVALVAEPAGVPLVDRVVESEIAHLLAPSALSV